MKRATPIRAVLSAFMVGAIAAGVFGAPREGKWRAWLDSPGGQLPFHFELDQEGHDWHVTIINGQERIVVADVKYDELGKKFVFDFPYYNSQIRARVQSDGDRMEGTWRKEGRDNKVTQLAFHASAGERPRFENCKNASGVGGVEGRWAVDFSESDEPAIGMFAAASQAQGAGSAATSEIITGTFLTPTGDYRYLEGCLDGATLRLSAFDGAHAFLFAADVQADGALKGEFWSGDKWHETWTAKRDAGAQLPDAFGMTQAKDRVSFSAMVFPDLDGKPRSLADRQFEGKVRIIEVFGSWCPNCHDASELMNELHERFGAKGLSIAGLAFEATGEPQRDAKQVRHFIERHKLRYPVLLGGVADKEQVAKALPMIDRFRAYPTFIITDAAGQVEAIYTGFSGPATGEAYDKLRKDFETIIERLLSRA